LERSIFTKHFIKPLRFLVLPIFDEEAVKRSCRELEIKRIARKQRTVILPPGSTLRRNAVPTLSKNLRAQLQRSHVCIFVLKALLRMACRLLQLARLKQDSQTRCDLLCRRVAKCRSE
jgi:hypothetical protein